MVEDDEDDDDATRCCGAELLLMPPVPFVLAIVAEVVTPCDCDPLAGMVIEVVQVDTEVNGVLTLLVVTLADDSEDSGEDSDDGDEEDSELVVPLDAADDALDTFGESEFASAVAVAPLVANEALLDAGESLWPDGWW